MVTYPAGGGTVELYPPNVEVGEFTLAFAVPDPGRFFVAWGGGSGSTQNPLRVNVHMPNVPVSALFAPLESNQVSFAAVNTGPGVLRKPEANVFTRGEAVSLEVDLRPQNDRDPKALRFNGWSGSYSGFGNPLNLALNESAVLRSSVSIPEVHMVSLVTTAPGEFEPAIGTDGTVYVTYLDYTSSYPTGEFVLAAFTPALELIWATNTGLRETTIPSIGDSGNIYVGSANGDVVAVAPGGTILWRFESGTPVSAGYNYTLPHPLVVSADDTIYSTLGSGDVLVVKNGQLVRTVPSYSSNGISHPSTPVIGPDGTLYVPTAGGFSAQTPEGDEKWAAAYPRPVAIDARGYLYSLKEAEIHALDFRGSKIWAASIPASANQIVVGETGTVFATTDIGVIAFATNGLKLWTTH